VDFGTFDILGDEEVRAGLKVYSNWPTFPQVRAAAAALAAAVAGAAGAATAASRIHKIPARISILLDRGNCSTSSTSGHLGSRLFTPAH